jgi:hypothetical protein
MATERETATVNLRDEHAAIGRERPSSVQRALTTIAQVRAGARCRACGQPATTVNRAGSAPSCAAHRRLSGLQMREVALTRSDRARRAAITQRLRLELEEIR